MSTISAGHDQASFAAGPFGGSPRREEEKVLCAQAMELHKTATDHQRQFNDWKARADLLARENVRAVAEYQHRERGRIEEAGEGPRGPADRPPVRRRRARRLPWSLRRRPPVRRRRARRLPWWLRPRLPRRRRKRPRSPPARRRIARRLHFWPPPGQSLIVLHQAGQHAGGAEAWASTSSAPMASVRTAVCKLIHQACQHGTPRQRLRCSEKAPPRISLSVSCGAVLTSELNGDENSAFPNP